MTASTPTQPGLHLFTSNRLETLADKLAARLRPPLASPFQPEIVVVRNKGMERWLKLQIAERLGVCAGCEFPFPEAFGQRVFRAVLPEMAKEPPLDRQTLAWRIAQVLPDLKERPGFAPVRGYLGEAGEPEDERKLIQLAARLANLFDQYVVFRPEMILEWDAGRDPQWQAELWRAVSGAGVPPVSAGVPPANVFAGETPDATAGTAAPPRWHPAALWKEFERAVLEPHLSLPEIPERVSIFGVSALAPFYLGLLAGLSRHRQVNLFLLQPSQEYWGEITSPREEDRILRRQHRPDDAAFELHLEPGNRLLASLGYLGRDFLKLVLGAGDWQSDESFAEPGEDSLLHCIQSDILHLRDRGRAAPVAAPGRVEFDDDSTPRPPHPGPLPLGGGEGGAAGSSETFERQLGSETCSLSPRRTRGEGWGEGSPIGLPPHPGPLPLGGGEGELSAVSPESEHGSSSSRPASASPSPLGGERAGVRGDWPDRRPVPPSDDSLQIHSCHSPLREMEVLYDRMLDWFERDPRLAPRDIVVMMPNVETYVPFILAVFGSPEDESRRIPFNLADRGARRESHVIDTFLKLLALPDTRLGSATVLAPLETPALRERFGLSEAALDTLRDWVRDANIRWGMDAAHRERLGLPDFTGHTWRAGLDRLLLGHAMAGRGERLFAGILPLDNIEGDAAALAGRLAEYIERVFELVHALGERRRLDEWAHLLDRALDSFFAVSEKSEREFQLIRGQIEALRRQQREAGFTRPIGRSALLERLGPALEEDLHNAGFLTGGVTFCGFKPMRSIPFRIVCLVGMDDGAFPRPTQRLSFDLMAQAPRLGDRSTREDDRYLFLETLLSARDRLYISYVGQSVKDNSPAPPSVLVSELLDYVEQGFTLARGAPSSRSARTEPNAPLPLPLRGGEGRGEGADELILQQRAELELGAPTLCEHLVTRHHLQAFHENYFNNAHPRFFSYSTENCRASVSARDARHASKPFLDRPLAEPGPEFRCVALEDIARFFFNPAKFFLRHRLGIALPDTPEELDEREPVLLDGLGRFRLRAQVLQRRLAGQHGSETRLIAQASGELPPGAVGKVDYTQCASRAEAFAVRLEKIRLAPPAPCDLSVTIGEFLFTGRLRERTVAGPLAFRSGRLRARDLLGAWLQHLAANCAQPDQTTTLLCEDTRSEFTPPADARTLLAALLELYWQGLRAPLKFFPGSALKFAEAERGAKRANSTSPFDKARGEWEGNEFNDIKGEREDAAFDLCFRHEEPLDETFAAHARAIFGPALAHETRAEA